MTNKYLENFKIAGPIILSLAGQSIVQIADSVMVGRTGAVPLAGVSFAGAIIMNVMVIGLGLTIGLTPIAGMHWARNEFRRVSGYFQNSLSVNLIFSLLLVVLLFAIAPLMPYLGQPDEVTSIVYSYYVMVSLSLIPMMIFLTGKQFLESVGNTHISMYITLLTNVVNIILNYLFIYGKMGFPAMGIDGAGLATLISRLLMPLILFIAINRKVGYRRFVKMFRIAHFSNKEHIHLIKIGLPISGQMVIEFFSLSAITFMMGWMGTKSLAANQIVQTMINFTFMIANGVAAASTILVSHSTGMGDIPGARARGFAGIRLSTIVMGTAALLFLFFGEEIATLFTTDKEVIAIAVKIFYVVAVFEIFDGLQVTALGALRGLTDTKRPMFIAIFSYLFISLPVAYIGGFVLNLGEAGLMSGFAFGLLVAATLFIRRFSALTK
ncbi:MAG: MATE family efflux transporter [Bacteroidales bacterium]|nr:MATE family efflux transporter [Bacteroidales bacterium]